MPKFRNADNRDTISVRIDSELKEQYQESVDSSMSTDLREHIESVVETKQSRAISTNDQTLRQAYQIICQLSESYQSTILKTDIVKTKLSDELNITKQAVKSGLLQQLEEQNLIKPLWGNIKLIDQQKQEAQS
jgi:hypothetical protein